MNGGAPGAWLVARVVAWTVGCAAAAGLVVPAIIERDQLRGEVESHWIHHAFALEYTANATALTEQSDVMRSMHDSLAARLTDGIDADTLRGRMRAEAVAAGLQIDSLEIAPRQLREFYARRPVRLVATGEARAAHALLVEILHAPPMRRIDGFSLQRTNDESATLLRLELVLNAYEYIAP